MKKKTIWTIAIIMGLSFMGLLYLQLMYMRSMVQMKTEQFDESVNRALYQASRNLELNETLRFLEKDMKTADRNGNIAPLSAATFQEKTSALKPGSVPKGLILNNDKNAISEASRTMQEIMRNRYVYQKALLDEVVYNIIYTASQKPLRERVNFKLLDQDLRAELMNNGIDIPYHFTVSTADGREVYRCPDYDDEGSQLTYSQIIFKNDPQSQMGVIRIHFPDMNKYIFSSVRFMFPSLLFTLVLLVTFIFTIVVVFRQKKISELRNDFINNMTHELKTPISSISLAAQMLNDTSLQKNEQMTAHLGGVIFNESKRLRFLVEKVLQMSLFDRKKVVYNMKDLDVNEEVEQIANTFRLRAEHTGGHLYTDIEAVDSLASIDEIHFQNVIFNLCDNALKYSKPDTPIELVLKTWNPDEKHICISVEDNGLGIKKDDLRKIFEKFYRVHTGNVHNVKGFGLGLAYVKQIVEVFGGTIKADSTFGKGTKFTITLKIIEES